MYQLNLKIGRCKQIISFFWEEHRWTDEKETGEKRPNPASPLAVEIIRKKEDDEKDRKKKQRED
ncbi:hypothetical protein RhiirA4_485322 [Rhizophagus irregularis]|uniref:Uncharacterized protein n=1 Tax=Rhizophagus irregularis TaxID=588596 RepID=A0A2I1HPZ2_9GLOM|nr:hypothetical protein RhiirA4_485322 [Rhizophagus irregularis]